MQWLFGKTLGSKFVANGCNTTDVERGGVLLFVFQQKKNRSSLPTRIGIHKSSNRNEGREKSLKLFLPLVQHPCCAIQPFSMCIERAQIFSCGNAVDIIRIENGL
jgi:hypothetical protein